MMRRAEGRKRRSSGRESGVGATATEAQAADAGGSVAGFRVLRRIAAGARCDVYLGASAAAGTDGHRDVVVLKVFRSAPGVGTGDGTGDGTGSRSTDDAAIDDAAIDREVRALEAIPDGGVGRLLDVATLPDGRICLVLAEDRGGSLGQILAGERLLDPGEAVTILAPVLAAVARLYDRGWVHPGIGAGRIRFDGAGRPVVGGLGGLRDLPPPGRAREELLEEARCACGDLVQAVLDRVADRGQPASTALFAAWRSGSYREALAGLERALFEWSPAAPVRLGEHEVGPGDAEPTAPRRLPPGPDALTRLEAALDTRAGPLLRGWAVRVAGTIGARLTARRREGPAGRAKRGRAAHALPPRPKPGRERTAGASTRRGTWRAAEDPARWRRRGLILSGTFLVVVLLVGAWTALAPPAAGPAPEPSSHRSASPRPSGGSGEVSAPDPPAAAPATTADQDALQGEDPAAATMVLLRLRALCLAAADRDCLADLAQPGSPVLAGDGALIGQAPDGGQGRAPGSVTVDGSEPTVVDRIGNLALIALSASGGGVAPGNDKPASVLVVKGEAGWRLREFFSAG
ncbi:hypothetical protein [Cryobacterium zhongshanensis]|uniref:Protein kinase domain-containing protein n=1 Tax=Cryobacterium zhongshanensis TaxID=2928153 RepID=A0AA41QUM2_9MICO|nr:hypothetical protein [Cryobacterium zhongshanensis]MCI4657764.1 hypothetical protein [Cryobacterium zhongshanensis]